MAQPRPPRLSALAQLLTAAVLSGGLLLLTLPTTAASTADSVAPAPTPSGTATP